jgi:hypothetical protein
MLDGNKWGKESVAMTGESAQDQGFFGRFIQPHTDEFYLLFRIVFAVLVGLHGAQKAFPPARIRTGSASSST